MALSLAKPLGEALGVQLQYVRSSVIFGRGDTAAPWKGRILTETARNTSSSVAMVALVATGLASISGNAATGRAT